MYNIFQEATARGQRCRSVSTNCVPHSWCHTVHGISYCKYSARIRMGNRDNLEKIIHISPLKHILLPIPSCNIFCDPSLELSFRRF